MASRETLRISRDQTPWARRQLSRVRAAERRHLARWRFRRGWFARGRFRRTVVGKRPAVVGEHVVAAEHDHSVLRVDVAWVDGGVVRVSRRHCVHLRLGPVTRVCAVELLASALAVAAPFCGTLGDRAPIADGQAPACGPESQTVRNLGRVAV